MKKIKNSLIGLTAETVRSQNGFSILAVVFVMLVLSVIGYSLTSMMATKQRSIPVTAQSSRAFYLAQGGLDWAGKYLDGLNPDEWSDFQLDCDDELDEGDASVTKEVGNGSFHLIFCGYGCTTDPSNQEITVISIGKHGDGVRRIRTTFHRELWFGCYEPTCS